MKLFVGPLLLAVEPGRLTILAGHPIFVVALSGLREGGCTVGWDPSLSTSMIASTTASSAFLLMLVRFAASFCNGVSNRVMQPCGSGTSLSFGESATVIPSSVTDMRW
jgi:hypothetical protein